MELNFPEDSIIPTLAFVIFVTNKCEKHQQKKTIPLSNGLLKCLCCFFYFFYCLLF